MIKTYNEHAAAFKYTAKVKLKFIIIIHHKRINQSSSEKMKNMNGDLL